MYEPNRVKIFGLVSGAMLVGEVLSENNKVVMLRHPAWFMIQSGKNGMQQAVPMVVQDWVEVSKRMKLAQANVLYSSSNPSQQILTMYENIRNQMTELSSGIRKATVADLNRLNNTRIIH